MTLLIALKGSDGMVLAADSRGTFGDPRGVTAQNDSIRKAFILTNHVAAVQAGGAELGAMVLKQTQDAIAKQVGIDGVGNVVNILHQTARLCYDAWFPSLPQTTILNPQTGVPMGRPDLTFIVGGYDKDQSGNFTHPSIYQLNSAFNFAPMIHDYGFAVAGVPTYALYLLNRLYQPDRKAEEELVPLAVYAISETASQDGKVGGPIRVVIVCPTGSKELTEAEVDNIVKRNLTRTTALRDSFYEGRATV
jgi:20S proteasome alpha/beta subunit